MDKLVEDQFIKIEKDILYGDQIAPAGSKFQIVSKKGQFNGFEMFIPPPEFEGLLLNSAIDSAAKAFLMKKEITLIESTIEGLKEVDATSEAKRQFFQYCQQAMISSAFSISAIESWANKTIQLLGRDSALKPIKLEFKNLKDKIFYYSSDEIASQRGITLVPKLFQLVPQVLNSKSLKPHSTLRQKLISVIDDRNAVMHMQQDLNIDEQIIKRSDFAVKMFVVNPFEAVTTTLKVIKYFYDNSNHEQPDWLTYNEQELTKIQRKYKGL
jgi:hypothetical protein